MEIIASPAVASSFFGTGEESFLSSSKRAGEMVRKSQPAKDLISPVYVEMVRASHADQQGSTGTHITERGTHDDGPVSVLLVVVVDLADGLNTRVLFILVSGSGLVLLVPVQNTADEGRDEGDAGLSTSDSLAETEQESEIAVNLLVALEFASSLDTLPGRGDLDENAFLRDANGLVELDQVPGLCRRTFHVRDLFEETKTSRAPWSWWPPC